MKEIEAEGITVFIGEVRKDKIVITGITPDGQKWLEDMVSNAIRKAFGKMKE